MIGQNMQGSHVYRDTPGYYDTLRATTQVSGWAYNAARDTEYDPAAKTVLANAPPTWSNNDLVANNSGSTGLLNMVENVTKGGLVLWCFLRVILQD